MQLVSLSLNALVVNVTKMLKRLIGEDIDLEFIPTEGLGNVRADAGQIEQVLMNFAVNARDAMVGGGKLTIETANVVLDKEYTRTHPVASPGRYVMLSVTDNGCGMDEATRERVFEPFFTTKEVGKGTGLGLATVYGIVKQHSGYIWVYSEQDKGTTFKVYLPRTDDSADQGPQREGGEPAQTEAPADAGTVLVVEDEEALLTIARPVLDAKGYTVLTATRPSEAEAVFARRADEIELLLTDVVMPGGNGPDLYQRLVTTRPSLKVLYMSGYTDVAAYRNGILKPGSPFIQKPFDPEELAQKVREVIERDPL